MSEVPEFDPVAAAAEIEATIRATMEAERMAFIEQVTQDNILYFERLDADLMQTAASGQDRYTSTLDVPTDDVMIAMAERYKDIGAPVIHIKNGTRTLVVFFHGA